MFTDIQLGKQYAWGARVVEIDGALSPTCVAARDVATGEAVTVQTGELEPIAKCDAKRLEVISIPQHRWEEAKARAAVLTPLLGLGRIRRRTLNRASKQLGLSPRQLQRLIKEFRQRPLVTTTLGKSAGRPTGTRMLDVDVEKVVTHCITKHYERLERPTVAFAYEWVEMLCRRLRLPIPSRMTFSRRIEQRDPYASALSRQGKKRAAETLGSMSGRLVTESALEVIQIDHTRVDLIVVTNDDQRRPLGRPWLTVALDVHTRCVLGIYLSMDQPSATAVALCIEHAIMPKDEWLRALGIAASWPMYGRPRKIYTDNATEFRGTAMVRGCEELGIILEFRPVGKPAWGGHVERLIGTLMRRIHCLPGTTFSNTREKEDYESEKHACMTLRELQEWLVLEICNWYHVRPHRGLGVSPVEAWLASFGSDAREGRP